MIGLALAGVVFVLLLGAGALGVAIGRATFRVPAPSPQLPPSSAVRIVRDPRPPWWRELEREGEL